MRKIGTDITEPHKTHNVMLTWTNPDKRRNSNNKNAQNAVTRAKLVPLSKRSTYALKNASEKKQYTHSKNIQKNTNKAKQVYLALTTKPITSRKHKTNGNVAKDHKLQQQNKLDKIGQISNC